MKSFNEYLLEQTLSPTEALAILGISAKDMNDAALKKAYRSAAMRAHPDRGGTDVEMQKINAAYDMLKNSKSVAVRAATEDTYRDEKVMAENYLGRIVPDNFGAYLSKIFDVKLSVDDKMDIGKHFATRVMEFASPDRETVIKARFSFYYANFARKKSLGGGDSGELIPGEVGTSYEILHNRQKMKLTKSTFDMTRSADVLTDPSVLFPESKITKKIKIGAESDDAVKWAKKRDFITTMNNKFSDGKMINGDTFQMKIGEYTIQGNRMTWMRKGMWTFNLFPRSKDVDYMATLPETNKSLDFIIDLLTRLKRSNDPKREWNAAAKFLKNKSNTEALFPENTK